MPFLAMGLQAGHPLGPNNGVVPHTGRQLEAVTAVEGDLISCIGQTESDGPANLINNLVVGMVNLCLQRLRASAVKIKLIQKEVGQQLIGIVRVHRISLQIRVAAC
jgi:hypothetical protein